MLIVDHGLFTGLRILCYCSHPWFLVLSPRSIHIDTTISYDDIRITFHQHDFLVNNTVSLLRKQLARVSLILLQQFRGKQSLIKTTSRVKKSSYTVYLNNFSTIRKNVIPRAKRNRKYKIKQKRNLIYQKIAAYSK